AIPARRRSLRASPPARAPFIPVIPFFFMTGGRAMVVAGIVSLIARFAVGAAKSLFTLRSWWISGLEMTLAGVLIGGLTYAVGLAFA
ncbi:MAG: VIT1/CCC1 transporter family protein, partial [Gaiellaceae bacterium]